MAIVTKTTRNRVCKGVCKRVCISILHRGVQPCIFPLHGGCATDYIYVHMHTLHKNAHPSRVWVSEV